MAERRKGRKPESSPSPPDVVVDSEGDDDEYNYTIDVASSSTSSSARKVSSSPSSSKDAAMPPPPTPPATPSPRKPATAASVALFDLHNTIDNIKQAATQLVSTTATATKPTVVVPVAASVQSPIVYQPPIASALMLIISHAHLQEKTGRYFTALFPISRKQRAEWSTSPRICPWGKNKHNSTGPVEQRQQANLNSHKVPCHNWRR